MKVVLAFILATGVISPAWSQTVVRGVGTQSCKTLVASDQVDEKFAVQAAQWILGDLTGHFRKENDDPSRATGDAILLQTVLDVCKNNPDKTIDEAVMLTIASLPTTLVKKPDTAAGQKPEK